ncbi:hypothetical protein BLNAU_3134 [Blattamonas nauphoetae]|uniref:Uncharacterized protein n=1 Tax=Blattamonas nauphoetae TaxID=2049346 RepID=A0ABQ9YD57_9EUKA|nr:hypothetical protein BLNAU_3134 [Blattamonas nauphoetae]
MALEGPNPSVVSNQFNRMETKSQVHFGGGSLSNMHRVVIEGWDDAHSLKLDIVGVIYSDSEESRHPLINTPKHPVTLQNCHFNTTDEVRRPANFEVPLVSFSSTVHTVNVLTLKLELEGQTTKTRIVVIDHILFCVWTRSARHHNGTAHLVRFCEVRGHHTDSSWEIVAGHPTADEESKHPECETDGLRCSTLSLTACDNGTPTMTSLSETCLSLADVADGASLSSAVVLRLFSTFSSDTASLFSSVSSNAIGSLIFVVSVDISSTAQFAPFVLLETTMESLPSRLFTEEATLNVDANVEDHPNCELPQLSCRTLEIDFASLKATKSHRGHHRVCVCSRRTNFSLPSIPAFLNLRFCSAGLGDIDTGRAPLPSHCFHMPFANTHAVVVSSRWGEWSADFWGVWDSPLHPLGFDGMHILCGRMLFPRSVVYRAVICFGGRSQDSDTGWTKECKVSGDGAYCDGAIAFENGSLSTHTYSPQCTPALILTPHRVDCLASGDCDVDIRANAEWCGECRRNTFPSHQNTTCEFGELMANKELGRHGSVG